MLNKTEPNRISIESAGIEDAHCNLTGISDVIVCMSLHPGDVPTEETLRSALYFLSRAVDYEAKRIVKLIQDREKP